MKRGSLLFCGSFVCTLALIAALYVIFVRSVGRGYSHKSEPWVIDVHRIKTELLQKTNAPKVVIMAGSGSYFSVDSKAIREATGMNVVNMAQHAMIPFRFFLYDIEHYLNENDILVLPLGMTHYYCDTDDKLFTDFAIGFLLGHAQEYQDVLSCRELFTLYSCYGISWINRRMMGQLHCSEFENDEDLLKSWHEKMTSPSNIGYFYQYMNSFGDSLVLPQKRRKWIDHPHWPPNGFTPEFQRDAQNLQKLADRKKIRVLYIFSSLYYYCDEADRYVDLQKSLKNANVRLLGRPEAFAFPSWLYHDTEYHMNVVGAKYNTHELVKVILHEIDGKREIAYKSIPWPHVVFAENPKSHFPGGDLIECYETGVRVYEKSFPLAVRLPDDLRGRDLDVSIVLKPSAPGNPAISAIRCGETKLAFEEVKFQCRSECRIFVPSNCTKSASLKLDFAQIGESVGMERLFMCESEGGATKLSDSYSVANDTDLIHLGNGFSSIEPWGCWTDGETAQFDLIVPARFKGKDLRLTFDALTFVTDGHPVCEFAFESAGERLDDFESRAWDHSFKLEVPSKCVKQGVLPLTIRIKNPISHAELGKGSDSRRLGIGLKRVRFLPKEDLR